MSGARTRRMLVVADTDSYLKWGASLATTLGAGWHADVVVLGSPGAPSARQIETALIGSRFLPAEIPVVDLDRITSLVRDQRPDAVLLATRGPMVRVVVRAIARAGAPRPVIASGLPGISYPAQEKTIIFREQVDLVILHSRREIRSIRALAENMPVAAEFGLATLPFLIEHPARTAPGPCIVFAAQAKVPRAREDRVRLLGWLQETARRHPDSPVVVKVRARAGEAQTHSERYDFAALLAEPTTRAEIGPKPRNLIVGDGPMAEYIARAHALVTVSSTAALEAIAAKVPVLLLDDFGVSDKLINTVFEGSGLLADSEALIAGDFRQPDDSWLADNYFHGRENDDWQRRLDGLVDRSAIAALPLKPQRYNRVGGRLRHAWDRKRMLEQFDDTVSGHVAAAVALPTLAVIRRLRKMRRRLRASSAASTEELQNETAGV